MKRLEFAMQGDYASQIPFTPSEVLAALRARIQDAPDPATLIPVLTTVLRDPSAEVVLAAASQLLKMKARFVEL